MSRKTILIISAIAVAFVVLVIVSLSSQAQHSQPASSQDFVTALPSSQPNPTLSPTSPEASSSSATTMNMWLGMLSELPEDNAPVSHSGYERDYFRIWIDSDSDGCNTRAEVLIAESQTATTHRGTCTIETGQWLSAYDGLFFSDASEVDIDHFVPLNEAWMSGAYAWDLQTRVNYGNDLGYDGSLLAVSAHSNRSKSDKDPSKWLPSSQNYLCDYSATWVAVKWRWNLSVDALEKSALTSILSSCSSTSAELPQRAVIILGQAPNQPAPNDGLDPDYRTCQVARANGKGPYIQGIDPEYDWYVDRDKDAMVCE